MVDTLTKAQRSERMSRVRAKDTGPEMRLRRLLHRLGNRYRLHARNLPGKPDLVFKSRSKVVWVHGCFWHRHLDPACKLSRIPKSRGEFWVPKLEGNRLRDLKNESRLRDQGWDYLIVWECELQDEVKLANRVCNFLEQDTSSGHAALRARKRSGSMTRSKS